MADRVFCIYSEQAVQKEARMPGAQRTLEAYTVRLPWRRQARLVETGPMAS